LPKTKVKRTATDSLILGGIVATLVVLVGILTIRPIFSLLGAKGIILDYIEEYMSVWYLGVVMIVIPMIGNDIIRAMGDTKIPGLIMGISAIINIILDPILIFGYGPIPAIGIKGAAIATVSARSITAITAISVLYFREHIITFSKTKFQNIIDSWKKILYIGIPNSLVQMALPVGAGIITRLLSGYGSYVVAGYGVATKIEFFSLSFTMALISVIGPFIGQNLGSRLLMRVDKGMKVAEIYSFSIGIVIAVMLMKRFGCFMFMAVAMAVVFAFGKFKETDIGFDIFSAGQRIIQVKVFQGQRLMQSFFQFGHFFR